MGMCTMFFSYVFTSLDEILRFYKLLSFNSTAMCFKTKKRGKSSLNLRRKLIK